MNNKIVREYCIGCGLCDSVNNMEMKKDEQGYLNFVNDNLNKDELQFIKSVCPMSTKSLNKLSKQSIWGKYSSMYLGYSTNSQIRTIGSSGGVLTALSIFLLDQNKIDGVLHTGMAKNSVIETSTYCSKTVEDIIARAGSRYSISAPLKDVFNFIEHGKKYLFIGKPCDVTALRNYIDNNPKMADSIPYIFSFFCAGLPSKKANLNLLSKFGLLENQCSDLTYRGNGWPGDVTITNNNGDKHSLQYEEAWGKILGRDIHKFCRFCMDGIGERADISCGDAWYLNEKNEPDFSNNEGRNIIVARNERGEELLKEALKLDYLEFETFDNLDDLHAMQVYQYDRKSTMGIKHLAMKLLLKQCPPVNAKLNRAFSKNTRIPKKFKIFKGTIKRILTRKI